MQSVTIGVNHGATSLYANQRVASLYKWKLIFHIIKNTNFILLKKSMDPSEFPFDIKAYKKQCEIEERYIVNRSRECRKNIEEEHASLSKRKYFQRDHVASNQKLIDDYFANQPTYDEAIFPRRFRMRKHVFLRIFEDLSSSDNNFAQRVDTSNKEGISPLGKSTTTMRMLSYSIDADEIDEYIKIGSTTVLEC